MCAMTDTGYPNNGPYNQYPPSYGQVPAGNPPTDYTPTGNAPQGVPQAGYTPTGYAPAATPPTGIFTWTTPRTSHLRKILISGIQRMRAGMTTGWR